VTTGINKSGSVKPKLPYITITWMRYLLGFSVSVAIGLVLYLGKLHIPGFVSLLSIIPESLQNVAIPLSSASMGIVAVAVQWLSKEQRSQRANRKVFFKSLRVCVGALFIFVVIESLAVVRVEVPAANATVSFAVGLSSPSKPPCEGLGRTDCISHELSLNEARINSYFGETSVNATKLLLLISYVVFTSSFGLVVGVLLISHDVSE